MSSFTRVLSWGLPLLLAGCAAKAPKVESPAAAAVSPALPETEVFDSSAALMPQAVTSFGAATLGADVYAFGGYRGVPHAYSREGQSGALWKLDPSTRRFELLAESEPTQGAPLVSLDDRLIRLGGMRAQNRAGEPESIASLDEVAAFSPSEGKWSALPPLPAARSSHAAAVLGRTVYVVGGWQLQGSAQKGRFADTLVALDLDTQRYRTLPQPFSARALAAAPLDGKLVALGGITPEGNISRAAHVFDPQTESWSRAADLPVDGFGVAAVSTGDVLYASTHDGTIYALSEPGGAWQPVAHLAFPRFFHQLVLLGGMRLVALGGISGMHAGPRIRQVEEIDLARPSPRVLSFTLSSPLTGRNRQGVFVYADSLYAFGGNQSLGQHDFAPEDFARDAARLDLAALAWVPLAPFPVARQTVQTLVEDNGALALGGFGHDGTDARAQADAYRYDIDHDRWTPDASVLPAPRTQFGLSSEGGTRWVFGGLDFKAEAQGEAQFEHPTSVLSSKEGAPFRDSGVRLPVPRRAFAGALLDGRYYLVGGMAGGFSPVTQCDVFELASSRWSQVPCPKQTRISAQLVALDGKLYLAGGSSANEGGDLSPNRALEVFDPKTSTWSTLIESLPIEPRHLTMLPYEHSLLLYSAHDEQKRAHLTVVTP